MPGQLVDLIAVAGDQVADIRATRAVRLVIKNGKVVVPSE